MIAYVSYSATALLMIALSILFLATLAFLPESPQYLVARHKTRKALDSLTYFRNADKNDPLEMEAIEAELLVLKKAIEERKSAGNKITLRDFSEFSSRSLSAF
jgi:hypothetical protein